MRPFFLLALPLGLSACDSLLGIPPEKRVPCSHDAPFVSFSPLSSINTAKKEISAWLTPDELTILFTRQGDIYTAHREDRRDDFGPSTPLDELNTIHEEFRAVLSSDGKTIYFDRAEDNAHYAIFTATRPGAEGRFGEPRMLTTVNTGPGVTDVAPFIGEDGLYFSSLRELDTPRIYFAPLVDGAFGSPRRIVPLPEASQRVDEESPVLSADGLTLYFSAWLTNAPPGPDVFMSSRPDRGSELSVPQVVESASTVGADVPVFISEDSCRLYVMTNRGGGEDIWVYAR